MADQRTPQIQTPKDGSAVDGMATTLSWDPVRDANHLVQVSANDRFDAVIVEADAGPSDSLTLYGLLPRDGRRLHWRVGVSGSEAGTRWSDPAWFLAADMDDRPPVKTVAPPTARTAAPERARPGAVDEEPLYLRGTTGSGEVVLALVVLLITMTVILIAAF